jgi:uncharacterized membrane protein/osmotically-inducible protein OsmY
MINKAVSLLGAAGLGAGLMYLLDPDRGTRRRAMTRDQAVHAANVLTKGARAVWRDTSQRTTGVLAEFRRVFERTAPSDRQVEARVRAELGYLVRHPRAIEVSAQAGHVTLRGPIHAQEVDPLLSRVRQVRGVASVDNHLEPHESAESIPPLQGGAPISHPGRQLEWFQIHWSPSARFAAGTAGGVLMLYGLWRRHPATSLAGLAGSALVARAASNLPLARLVGAGAGRRAVDIRKTMTIAAPRLRVFEFWSRYVEFPRYTRHVLDIRQLGEGRSRWKVLGPAGMALTWISVITDSRPNKLLAWKTERGSAVQHAGLLRFMDSHDGGTIIHLRMSYNPPGGALAHGAIKVFGSDLESLLEEEFMRIKTFLETESIPQRAEQSSPQ